MNKKLIYHYTSLYSGYSILEPGENNSLKYLSDQISTLIRSSGQLASIDKNDLLDNSSSKRLSETFPNIKKILLRASRIENLNDKTEMKHGISRLQKSLKAKSEYEYIDDVFEDFSRKKGQKSVFDIFEKNTYVISFSKVKNDLNQWRIYSDSGKGVSIGFDVEDVVKMYGAHLGMATTEILYEETKINESIGKTLDALEKMYKRDSIKSNLELLRPEHKGLEKILEKLLIGYSFIQILLSVKNKVFKSEQEVRFYLTPLLIDYASQLTKERSSYEDYFYGYLDKGSSSYTIDNNIRFYRTAPLPISSIKEIWLGPKSLVDIEDMKNILKGWGYSEVSVYKSDLPLR